jgi:hypothetical protein
MIWNTAGFLPRVMRRLPPITPTLRSRRTKLSDAEQRGMLRVKQEEKEKAETYRRQLAEQEMKRRAEKERERLEKERKKNAPKRAPFDFAREKPQILLSIAHASQSAISLVNACRVSNNLPGLQASTAD